MSALLVVATAGIQHGTIAAASGAVPDPPEVRVRDHRLVDAEGRPAALHGVNISGTEFACAQQQHRGGRGWSLNGDAALGELSTYRAIATWRADVVRIPLNEDCWLGVNGVAHRFGGAAYRDAIARMVSLVHRAGMAAVLDLHWSAPGDWAALAQQAMPDADHAVAFWRSVATRFRSDPGVMFDLFNEPFPESAGVADPWECWSRGCKVPEVVTARQRRSDGQRSGYKTRQPWRAVGMQRLVDVVRATGARQPIIVSGIAWANELSGWLEHQPDDPLRQLVAGWHSYPDQRCSDVECWRATVRPVARHVPVVISEVGDHACGRARYLEHLLPWADRAGVSYLAWTWNPWRDCSNVLIRDWAGTPTSGMGRTFRERLRRAAPS